jgi:hypothetical protein
MNFEILGEISNVETFATGSHIRRACPPAKSFTDRAAGANARASRASVSHGAVLLAEVHWYEAAEIGRKEFQDQAPAARLRHGKVSGETTRSCASATTGIQHRSRSEKFTSHFGMMRRRNWDSCGSSMNPADDYLYPKALFRPIALPDSVKRAVLAAA